MLGILKKPVLLQIRLILIRLLFLFRRNPRFKVGDTVVSKTDLYVFTPPTYYMKVVKIEKDTIIVRHPIAIIGLLFYRPDDLVKIELTKLERVIYGFE